MSNFHVGQKVVCVSDDWFDWQEQFFRDLGLSRPVKGSIYTVRSTLMMDDELHLWLSEITNPVLDYADVGKYEQGWSHELFRPIVTRKSDISIFKAMLAPSKHPVAA